MPFKQGGHRAVDVGVAPPVDVALSYTSVAVGDGVGVVVALSVAEGVAEIVCVGVSVAVGDDVSVAVGVDVLLAVGVTLAEAVWVGVASHAGQSSKKAKSASISAQSACTCMLVKLFHIF